TGTLHVSEIVVVGLLLALAWAAPHEGHDHGAHTTEHHHHLHHGKDEPHPHHNDKDAECHLLSPHNADFAFSLYKKLSALPESKSKNVFFSPLGISMALSMLAIGAKGDTHSELYKALGYSSLTQAQVNEAYEHLLHMLAHGNENVQLDAGSAVALRDGFKVLDKFLEDAKHYFESEVFNVDFSKPEVAVQEINKYISKKTHNKIPDMLKDLHEDTVMMLINFMYFRGKWEKHFEEKNTHKADFHVDENTKVTVDMMKRTGRYEFYHDRENFTSVIMLPYKGGNASMMIVLPDEGKMAEVEASICKYHIKHWHDSMFRSSVDVFLPKFSISAQYALDDILKELGVVSAFSDTADFSNISEETRTKVSKVSHKAVLSVDERGTEAAAATTIEIMPMSLPSVMNLNRPFLVLIVEDSTRSILFMGKISDPTAK
uniref:Serpin domain-containing protein n=1 Tax=Denticeps clupeoides TaxID=299321 RepID=A0AAY4D2P0_9TELE